MPIATDGKGNTVFLDQDGSWKPARMATNPQTGESLAFDGQAWLPIAVPKPEASATAGQDQGYLSGITNQLRQGASFGLADEIGAAGAGLGGGIVAGLRGQNVIDGASNSYNRRLDEIRGSDKAFFTEHPIASVAANVGGALPVAAGLAPFKTAQGAGLAARSMAGAGNGALQGSVYGFNSGENNADDRMQNAALSAILSGGVRFSCARSRRSRVESVKGYR